MRPASGDRADGLAYKYKVKSYGMVGSRIVEIQFSNRFVEYMRKTTLISLQTQTSPIGLRLNPWQLTGPCL